MSDPRSLAGRIGAHESWARTSDRAGRTQAARDAFQAKFETQVDPDGALDPEERALRAESARRAYYARLAMKSAQARRKAKP